MQPTNDSDGTGGAGGKSATDRGSYGVNGSWARRIREKIVELTPVTIDEAVAETMHLVPHCYSGRHCNNNRASGALSKIHELIHRGLVRMDNGLLYASERKKNATEIVIGNLITTGKCDCSGMWSQSSAKQARKVLKRLGWIPEDSTGCRWQFIGPSDATVQQFTREREKDRKVKQ